MLPQAVRKMDFPRAVSESSHPYIAFDPVAFSLGPLQVHWYGIMYLLASLVFFLVGGLEALLMRIQLGTPEITFLSPEAYNQIFTMHGTTMIFLVVVPMLVTLLVPGSLPAAGSAYQSLVATDQIAPL